MSNTSFVIDTLTQPGLPVGEMFKKKKNKTKDDILNVHNSHQKGHSPKISSNSSTVLGDENGDDSVDGFDPEGFVDLNPEEHQPKLLGPKQSCQYIGTFAVTLSGSFKDGETTLTTHKERTRFVKKKLREYRDAQKGVGVFLLISSDGIKVISADGQRVRMAHALQRISFATCDPEFRLFAYMSHNPSPMGTAIHCHVFMTKYVRQVQSLTAMIGKAFQLAFADSKFPKGTELKMEPLSKVVSDERVVQGRRWAKLEARQGHEHSQHAIVAKMKKHQEKSHGKSPSTSQEEPMPSAPSVQPSASSQGSPFGRRRSFGKAHTPPEVRRSDLAQRNLGGNEQRTNLSDDVVTDAVTDGSPEIERKRVRTPGASQLQPEDRKISAPATILQDSQETPQELNVHVRHEKERPLSSEGHIARGLSQTPPPSRSDKKSASVIVTNQQNLMSPIAKSSSDPNLVTKGGSTHKTVSKRNSHENEDWYMPGIPREFVTEMLEKAEEGSFFVRDSQSRPGCYALTMRVPQETSPSGFGNFLIVKVKDGVMIQGFDKVLTDLTSLVEHYSQNADGLPCKLLLCGSNVLCEDEDYICMVPNDPDYQNLSDFTAMMAELN